MTNLILIVVLTMVLCAMAAFVESNTFRNIVAECLMKKGNHVVSKKKVDRVINVSLAVVAVPALTCISFIMVMCLFTPE